MAPPTGPAGAEASLAGSERVAAETVAEVAAAADLSRTRTRRRRDLSGSPHTGRPSPKLTESNFRERKEHELATLPDEQLISYIQKARAAGRTETMTLALSVLVFGYLDIVTRRVALKVPPADVDDVAHEAILSAIRSAFAGESIGEFRAWLNRITLRRIADYHRKLEGKPKTVPLLSGDEEDDAGWGEVPTTDFEGVRVDAERAIETAYEGLSEAHQRIVDAYVFADRPASEVASAEGTSEDNVHQVASRFRRRVRELLEDGDS